MTRAVTVALSERLERERAARRPDADLPARIKAFSDRVHCDYDRHPISRAEWDWAGGDDVDGRRA